MTKKRPKRTDERTVIVAGFVPPDIKRAIVSLADKEEVTVSYKVRQLLEGSPSVQKELQVA
jgi:hypothetical protein